MTAYRALTHRGSEGGIISNTGDVHIMMKLMSCAPPETADVDNEILPVTQTNVIAQEGSAGVTDSIDLITGGATGDILLLRCATPITLVDGVGSVGGLRLESGNDYLVASSKDTIWFIRSTDNYWLELGRSVNG